MRAKRRTVQPEPPPNSAPPPDPPNEAAPRLQPLAAAFAVRLGLPVRDLDLLGQALVHSSWLHEHRDEARGHNERLEFLGDAVINLAMSEALFARHPEDDEGVLSSRRAAIVSSTGLARLASRIDLGDQLLLGEGEAARGGRRRPSLLSSSFEALAGAVYLDLGWAATRDWLVQLASPDIVLDTPPSSLKSPKSRLQEYTQRRTGGRPMYRVLDATGPDHDKVFRIEVVFEGEVLGRGEGPSRRVAETEAAAEAVETLRRRQLRRQERAAVNGQVEPSPKGRPSRGASVAVEGGPPAPSADAAEQPTRPRRAAADRGRR